MTILRLGLIAPEFPPQVGGMASLAAGLARGLAATDEVTVYTVLEHGVPGTGIDQLPILERRLDRDAARLDAAPLDAWLALNAGLVPLAPRLETPFFVYLHGNDFLDPWIPYGPSWLERIRRPYWAALRHGLRRRAIRRASDSVRGFFANSRGTAELAARALGVLPARIEAVPPGVDDDFFQTGGRRARGDGEPLRLLSVAWLSRYVARKNVDGVLRAVALLGARLPVVYTVVGDGDDRPRLETLARELGIAERVRFTGRIDRAELLERYAEADLFILASRAGRRDVEGFGIVYLEACAAGVPVVASRAGGAVDAVRDGVNGILLPDSTPEAIAAGIERFAAERARFSPERARGFAEDYRWPKIAARVRGSIAERLGVADAGRPAPDSSDADSSDARLIEGASR